MNSSNEYFLLVGDRHSPEEYGYISVVASKDSAETEVETIFGAEGVGSFAQFAPLVQKNPIFPTVLFCAFGSAIYKFHAEKYLAASIESMRRFMQGVKEGFNSFVMPDGSRIEERTQLYFLRKVYEFSEKITQDFDLVSSYGDGAYIPTSNTASSFLVESIHAMFIENIKFDHELFFRHENSGKAIVLGMRLDRIPMDTIRAIEKLGVGIVKS